MEEQNLSNQNNQTNQAGPTLVDMQRFQKKKSRNGKKVLIVLILAAIISGAVYYFFFLNKDNAEPVTSDNNSNISGRENKIDKNLDSDSDDLPDYMEKILKTNPNNPDTDGDGYSDFNEIKNGYSPLASEKFTEGEWDNVKEKIKKEEERLFGEMFGVVDRKLDTDGDGLPDYMEKIIGSDSSNKDTDGDGDSDYMEILVRNNPLEKERYTKYTEDEWSVLMEKIRAVDITFYKTDARDILEYEVDLENVDSDRKSYAMQGIEGIFERKMRDMGIEKPIVEIKYDSYIIIDVTEITDVELIKQSIGEATSLDFRIESSKEEYNEYFKNKSGNEFSANLEGPYYIPTDLTGKYLTKSSFGLDPNTRKPVVNLEFNEEGKKLFADLTAKNIGKKFAVYLDEEIITAPVINEAMLDGKAVITGNFTVEEALSLANRLYAGALALPIKLSGSYFNSKK